MKWARGVGLGAKRLKERDLWENWSWKRPTSKQRPNPPTLQEAIVTEAQDRTGARRGHLSLARTRPRRIWPQAIRDTAYGFSVPGTGREHKASEPEPEPGTGPEPNRTNSEPKPELEHRSRNQTELERNRSRPGEQGRSQNRTGAISPVREGLVRSGLTAPSNG